MNSHVSRETVHDARNTRPPPATPERTSGRLAAGFVPTNRSAYAHAVAALRDADPSGQAWRQVLGTLELLRVLLADPDGLIRGSDRTLAEELGYGSRNTWATHRDLLITAGLLEPTDDGYVLTRELDVQGRIRPADEPAQTSSHGGSRFEPPPAQGSSQERVEEHAREENGGENDNHPTDPDGVPHGARVRENGAAGDGRQQQQRKPWRQEVPELAGIVAKLEPDDRERFERDAPAFRVWRRLGRDVATYLAHGGRRAHSKLAEELTDGTYAGADNAWVVAHARIRRLLTARGIDPENAPEPLPPPPVVDDRPEPNRTAERDELESMYRDLETLPDHHRTRLEVRVKRRRGGSLPAHPDELLRAVHAELVREREEGAA